jgi:hypothetical protein
MQSGKCLGDTKSLSTKSIFIQPRWHTDGYYYSPKAGVTITLKGPATLFTQPSQANRIIFDKLQLQNNQQDIGIL